MIEWFTQNIVWIFAAFMGISVILSFLTKEEEETEEEEEEENNEEEGEGMDIEDEYKELKKKIQKEDIPNLVLKETENIRLIEEWNGQESSMDDYSIRSIRVCEWDLFVEIFKKMWMFNKMYICKYEDEDDTDNDEVRLSFMADDGKIYRYSVIGSEVDN